MFNITSLLDRAKTVGKLKSDRALAKAMGMGSTTIHSFRHLRSGASDATIMRLCEIAGEDPLPWLLAAQIERTEPESRPLWEKLAAQYAA